MRLLPYVDLRWITVRHPEDVPLARSQWLRYLRLSRHLRIELNHILLNGLEVSADAIFCDVLDHSTGYKASELSAKLDSLPPQAQKRILQMVELMIQQETSDNG